MNVLINKSSVSGEISVPASKSYTIRALMCAALARGESAISNPLFADDTLAAATSLRRMGIDIKAMPHRWVVNGGIFTSQKSEIHCAESATTQRMMTAILTTIPGKHVLQVAPSLAARPIDPLINALAQLGANIQHSTDGTMVINGGRLAGGEVTIRGDISSQYISALLLIGPLTERGLTILLSTPLHSKPYVAMTLDCMRKFGINVQANDTLTEFSASPQEYQPADYEIEGDWSSASYLLATGALLGEIKVLKIEADSLQADKKMLTLLQEMGTAIKIRENNLQVTRTPLRAVQTDLNDAIDTLPTMAILAAGAQGTSVLSGIARARLKESNRVKAIVSGLSAMNIIVKEDENSLTIEGGTPLGAQIDSVNDHRIAMAFAVLGGLTGNTVINGAECVKKTFPDFWEAVRQIGMKVVLNDK